MFPLWSESVEIQGVSPFWEAERLILLTAVWPMLERRGWSGWGGGEVGAEIRGCSGSGGGGGSMLHGLVLPQPMPSSCIVYKYQ